MINIALTVIGLLMLALVISAAVGFFWAGKTGQLKNLEEGAKVIFDEDEPIGTPTDMVFKKKTDKPRGDNPMLNKKEES